MDTENREQPKQGKLRESILSTWDAIKTLSLAGAICSILAVLSWLIWHITGKTQLSFISLMSSSLSLGILGFIIVVVALMMRKSSKDPAGVLKISQVGLVFSLILPVLSIFPNGLLGLY